MNGPYVSEDGDVWFERGDTSWNEARKQAKWYIDGWDRIVYVGIETGVRVSDELEYVHGDDDACADAQGADFDSPEFAPCCRDIEAYHFRGEDR